MRLTQFSSLSLLLVGFPVRRIVAVAGLLGLAGLASPLLAQSPSLQSITQREIVRRQGLLRAAEAQLAEAQLLVEKGKPDEASQALLTAYEGLPEVPMAEDMRNRLRTAYSSAACIWAKTLLDQARYAEASKVLNNILDPDVDPENKDALRLRKRMADADRYPPALTPEHISHTKEVIRLLTLAGSHVDLGAYDKAVAVYQDVLRIDRYNTAARRGMERIERLKSGYQGSARDHARAKLIGIVDQQWEDAVPVSQSVASMFGTPVESAQATARDQIAQKLRTLVVPKVQFTDATLDEVMDYLRLTSRNIDPTGRGVDFIINLEAEARNRKLSLNLNNLPLEELVRYVTQNAGATYRIEPNAVVIASLTEHSTALITKSYKVPPDFIQTAAVDPAAGAGAADPFAKKSADSGIGQGLQVRRMGAKEFLEGRGVTFAEGAAASFSANTSTLVVRNTADNIAIVDTLVEAALSGGAKQAVISVKMIDVTETRLNELGFDWLLGQSNVPGSNRMFISGGGIGNQGSVDTFGSAMPAGGNVSNTLVTAGLRSSGAILGKPSIDGLIAASSTSGAVVPADSRSPAQFALAGVLTDPGFQVAMRSLSQAKGVDLVTCPSITVKSGQKSSVREVREFPYPTEFDPPQIPQNFSSSGGNTLINLLTGTVTTGGTSGAFPITPTTPTAFTTKEVGTILEVEPVISEDGRSVDLTLAPSDIEFEGFIDYGSPINSLEDNTTLNANLFAYVSNGTSKTIHENHIYQPVFRNSHTNQTVRVYDGATVVLGGLVSEKKTDINDKVPVIGDLPLVGRFWQSKVVQSEKRCLIFFVTVKVIDPGGNRIFQASAGEGQ